MTTRKGEQLAREIERALRQVISRGFADPRISGLITVTGVKLGGDLRVATCLVSVLPEEKATLTMHGLTAAAAFIRREVGDIVATRAMPELLFKLDKSLKNEARVLEALDRVRDEIRRTDASASGSTDASESAPGGEPTPS